jgi:hypothetical protein
MEKKAPKNDGIVVAVGDRVRVNLRHGRLEDGTVKTIVERANSLRYQIDLGGHRTALVHQWQITEKIP